MEITLLRDADWKPIEDCACRVTEFNPLGSRVEDGEIISTPNCPYASVNLECSKLPQEAVGFICHKLDFLNLWTAFHVRGVAPDEEVIIFWSKRHLKWFAKLTSFFMPRLCVMICPKGACELMNDPNFRPELTGEARFLAKRPIVTLKPDAWE